MSILSARNANTILIHRPEDVDTIRLGTCRSIYVLSGASTPMDIIKKTVARLQRRIERSAGKAA